MTGRPGAAEDRCGGERPSPSCAGQIREMCGLTVLQGDGRGRQVTGTGVEQGTLQLLVHTPDISLRYLPKPPLGWVGVVNSPLSASLQG